MAERLAPLVREAAANELRRLTGRRRRPRRTRPQLAAAPTPVAPPSPPSDPWATHVLDYAERMLSSERAQPPDANPNTTASAFERLELGLLPDAIGHIVRAAAPVPENDLVRLIRSELMLGELPSRYERLLGRFVWSAKGRRVIELRDGAWVPGAAEPGPIRQLEGHSLDTLARMAAELDDEDQASEDGVYRAMIADLAGEGERAPRIVSVTVGVAVSLARQRGDLPAARWGQQSLLGGVDG